MLRTFLSKWFALDRDVCEGRIKLSRKRMLRVESLETRRMLSVAPMMQPDPYPLTPEESAASNSAMLGLYPFGQESDYSQWSFQMGSTDTTATEVPYSFDDNEFAYWDEKHGDGYDFAVLNFSCDRPAGSVGAPTGELALITIEITEFIPNDADMNGKASADLGDYIFLYICDGLPVTANIVSPMVSSEPKPVLGGKEVVHQYQVRSPELDQVSFDLYVYNRFDWEVEGRYDEMTRHGGVQTMDVRLVGASLDDHDIPLATNASNEVTISLVDGGVLETLTDWDADGTISLTDVQNSFRNSQRQVYNKADYPNHTSVNNIPGGKILQEAYAWMNNSRTPYRDIDITLTLPTDRTVHQYWKINQDDEFEVYSGGNVLLDTLTATHNETSELCFYVEGLQSQGGTSDIQLKAWQNSTYGEMLRDIHKTQYQTGAKTYRVMNVNVEVPPQETDVFEWSSADFFMLYLTGNTSYLGSNNTLNLDTAHLSDDYRRAPGIISLCDQYRMEARDQTIQDLEAGNMSSEYSDYNEISGGGKSRNVTDVPGLWILGNGVQKGDSTSSIVFDHTEYQYDAQGRVIATKNYYNVTANHTFCSNDEFTDPFSFDGNGYDQSTGIAWVDWLITHFNSCAGTTNSDIFINNLFTILGNLDLIQGPAWNTALDLAIGDAITAAQYFGNQVIHPSGLTGNDCAAIIAQAKLNIENGTDVHAYDLLVQWLETETYTIEETVYSGMPIQI